ncbi:maleylpyruvate isomerase family mycothiol-dependent enzyme [Herbiconiux solani]|uniref:maleylpyruvate isomerase family mycothiol-dependent enzyme n=1 Tax=Herbiconiux solani TaxID=661329 RepID=UPI0008240C7D|nr:maleylpyruvate isomerase family mycothiol-dependent enzyme [Herbiconiux solani]
MGSREWADTWAAVHDERRALSADLAQVDPARWADASLCSGWDIHDVVAHLIDSATTTRLGFARRMLAARFDFDRDNEVGVSRERRSSPAETLAAFDRIVPATATPPAARATRLVEAVVHGEDIRRPLGLHRDYPLPHVLPALAYQLKTSVAMGGGRQRAAGFRLIPTDAPATALPSTHRAPGSTHKSRTPEAAVRAPALTLLLAVSGRPVDEAEFEGPGAQAFAEHLAASG